MGVIKQTPLEKTNLRFSGACMQCFAGAKIFFFSDKDKKWVFRVGFESGEYRYDISFLLDQSLHQVFDTTLHDTFD